MGDGKFKSLAASVLAVVAGLSALTDAAGITPSAESLYPIKTDQHVAFFVTEGSSSLGTDLSIFSGSSAFDVYAEVAPLPTRVSGVDLFSSQAVFQYGASEFYNSSPVTTMNLDALESQALQNTSLTSAPPASLEQAISAQLLSIDFAAGEGPNAGKVVITLDQFAPADVSVREPSTQLDVSAVADDFSLGLGETVNLTSPPAAAAPPPRELARGKATSISVPTGSASPAITPEPASMGLIGIAACGMLARRRARKA